MQIFVKTFLGKTITIDIEETDTIVTIKEQILRKIHIPIEKQRLLYKGKPLIDEDIIKESGISKGSTLYLTVSEVSQLKLSGTENPQSEQSETNKRIIEIIYDNINTNNGLGNLYVFIPASQVNNLKGSKGSMSNIYHETFRQQLPIPLLRYCIDNDLNLVIFSIDLGYKANMENKTELDIDVLLLEKLVSKRKLNGPHEQYIVTLQNICNHEDICNFHDKTTDIKGNLYYNKIGLPIEGLPNDLFSLIDKSRLHKYIFYSNWIDPAFVTNLEPEIIVGLKIYSKQRGGKRRKTKRRKTNKRSKKNKRRKTNKKNKNK